MKTLYVKTAAEWRNWLARHHDTETELWLIFYKKSTGQPSLDYESAVEEALCFGWIDSIIKKLDEASFARKFTPRKDRSKWSPTNKKRIEKLMASGRMAPAVLARVKAARANGMWDKPDRPEIRFELPTDFREALAKNAGATEHFEKLASSYQKQFISWVSVAKRPETRVKRINESVRLLAKGEKLGLR